MYKKRSNSVQRLAAPGNSCTYTCLFLSPFFHSCYSRSLLSNTKSYTYKFKTNSTKCIYNSVICKFFGDIRIWFQKNYCFIHVKPNCSYIFFSLTHCTRNISYFHLLSHAVFKCLLFLSSGIMLHSANSIQDIRTLQFYHSKSVNFTLFLTGNISLVGFPFLTGFFSKDTIYENFLGHSGGGSLLILLSIICTAAYRIKLFLILSVPRNPKNFLEESSDYKIIRLRSIGLWVFVFTFGRIGWLISLNFWYLYKIYWPIKLLPLLMLIQGSFLGYKLKNSHLYFPSIMGLIPIRTAFLVHQQSLLKFLLYIELRISFTPTSFFINSAIHQLLFKPNFYLRIMLVVIISSYVFWI